MQRLQKDTFLILLCFRPDTNYKLKPTHLNQQGLLIDIDVMNVPKQI